MTDPQVQRPEDPTEPGAYPPYVTTEEERKRWDTARNIAEGIFEDDGAESVWMATRAIYNSPVPTDDPPEAANPSAD